MTNLFLNFFALEWKIAQRYPLKIALTLFHIAMILCLFFYISQTLGEIPILKGQYFPFVATGLAFQYFFSGLLNSSPGKIIEWRDIGVLENILLSPKPPWKIFLTAGSYESIFSLLKFSLIIIGLSFFTKIHLNISLFLTTLALSALIATALSITSTLSFLLWKKVSIIETFGSLTTLFLSGVYFPIEVLPWPLKKIAMINPIYHGLELLRTSLGIHSPEYNEDSLFTSLTVLICWLAFASLLSFVFYKASFKSLESKGSLSHH